MAISTAAAIVGSAVIGGVASHSASKRAASAQRAGYDAATAEQRRQYDQTRQDFAPWRQTGKDALGRLNAMSAGDMSSFQASPGYNFVRQEGQRDIGNSFAARGGALSGNALRALTQYNQSLASNEFGNFWNRQAGLAGVGQSATQNTAAFGANAANNIANNFAGAGNARASGIQGSINGINSAIQGGIANWMYARGSGMLGKTASPANDYWTQQASIYGG